MKKKPIVVLTYPIHRELIRTVLAPRARVVMATTPSALRRALPNAEGLITLLTNPVDERLLARAPRLKVVGNMAVGVDNVDLKACKRRGIAVTNTPGVLTRATAETALALTLAAARRFPEGQAMCRAGTFKGWVPDMLLGLEMNGRHAVIAGPGRIGRETARLFRALGMTTEAISRRDAPRQIGAKLRRAQVLSIHLPLTSETRHWLGAARIALLPRDAIVVNTSRGGVIDEGALARALRAKQIFAAGLDVYEREPRIHPLLRRLPNAVLLPHLGSATQETRREMARLAITGVLGILGGHRVPNRVV